MLLPVTATLPLEAFVSECATLAKVAPPVSVSESLVVCVPPS